MNLFLVYLPKIINFIDLYNDEKTEIPFFETYIIKYGLRLAKSSQSVEKLTL